MSNTNKLQNIINELSKMDFSSPKNEFGEVIGIENSILTLCGLQRVELGEVIQNKSGEKRAMIISLNVGYVKAINLDIQYPWFVKDYAMRTKQQLSVKVHDTILFGKILDGFGNPQFPEPFKLLEKDQYIDCPVFSKPRSFQERKQIDSQLFTGVCVIDWMFPIGYGQRQLILGDKQTGKTSLLINSMIQQCQQDNICIYVSIGQDRNKIQDIYNKFILNSCKNFIIVEASSSDSAAELYLAPYVATAIGEYFVNHKQKNVIIGFDTLDMHAKAYREISLLVGNKPGKNAYPADIFYQHASLLERGVNLVSGGSITMLPVVTTVNNEISDYIPTNVISITDGQLILDYDNLLRSIYPPIDIGKSVSRIGMKVMTKEFKKLVKNIKIELITYRKLQKSTQVIKQNQETHNKMPIAILHQLLQQNDQVIYPNWMQLLLLHYYDKLRLDPLKYKNISIQQVVYLAQNHKPLNPLDNMSTAERKKWVNNFYKLIDSNVEDNDHGN